MHHYLHDWRSLDIHRLLGERLKNNPGLLTRLKEQFALWDALPHGSQMKAEYRQAWLNAVDAGVDAVYALATEDSERGQVLRSCSPFGVLWASPGERLAFMRAWQKQYANIPVPWKGSPVKEF
jgi:hypothetical protein